MQDGLLPIDDQRVACVVPTLEAYDGRCPIRQQINDLALALVTPLSADYD